MSTEIKESVAIIEKKINPLIEASLGIVIATQADVEKATVLLSEMNLIMDAVTAEKEKMTRPLLDALAVERNRWKPIEDAYKQAITPLREKLGAWQAEELARIAKEADQLASDIESGAISLDEASTALSQANAKGPEKKVTTATGSLTFKAVPKLKITDRTAIPKKYWVVDEDAVFSALKLGVKVKGAEIEIVQIPINRRG